MRRVRVTIVAFEKQQILRILNVCVVSVCTPHEIRVLRVMYIVTCGPSYSTTLPTLYHKRHDFMEKVTERTICVLIFREASV
jgi:hypothetical protein